MKILQTRWLVLLAVAGLSWFSFVVYYSRSGDSFGIVNFSGETMGTTYHIRVREVENVSRRETIQQTIDLVLQSVVQELSTWQEDSAIAQFNRSQNLAFQQVPLSLWKLVRMAKDLWWISDGLYDVSAGALFRLWGFGKEQRSSPPTDTEIRAVMQHVGMDKLVLHHGEQKIRKSDKNLQLDLSSIAKGYAVDVVAQMLEEEGISNYLVEIGGEIRVKGKKARQQHWRIAVEKPLTTVRTTEEVFAIKDMAMATSGNYRNFFEENGKRYAHIFNVKTGYPIKSRLASVTVFASTATLADGWATALFASGQEKAQSMARVMALPVWMMLHHDKQDKEFEIWTSPAFVEMIEKGTIKRIAIR